MNQRPPAQPPVWGVGNDLATNLAVVAILGVGAVSTVIWAGAQVAAIVFSGGPLDASLADAATALLRLPDHGRNPAAAWAEPHDERLPGALAYWTSTALVAAAALVLIGGVWWLWSTRWRAIDPTPSASIGPARSPPPGTSAT